MRGEILSKLNEFQNLLDVLTSKDASLGNPDTQGIKILAVYGDRGDCQRFDPAQ